VTPSQSDQLESFHSPIKKWEVLVYIAIASAAAIIFDRLVDRGHLQLVGFTVLLTIFYLRIFRNALRMPLVVLIICAAFVINAILVFILPKESSGLPAIASVPLVILEFCFVYVCINLAIRRYIVK
jgi:hypothetical protein